MGGLTRAEHEVALATDDLLPLGVVKVTVHNLQKGARRIGISNFTFRIWAVHQTTVITQSKLLLSNLQIYIQVFGMFDGHTFSEKVRGRFRRFLTICRRSSMAVYRSLMKVPASRRLIGAYEAQRKSNQGCPCTGTLNEMACKVDDALVVIAAM